MSETPPPPSPHENGLAHKASKAIKKLISSGGERCMPAAEIISKIVARKIGASFSIVSTPMALIIVFFK